jgi:hypothetical protein
MGDVLKIPVPKTPEGARKLGLLLEAEFRAQRWARRRRGASYAALVTGGLVVVDTTFELLGHALRRLCLAGWWTALAVALFAALVEIWATAKLYRMVRQMEDEARASPV